MTAAKKTNTKQETNKNSPENITQLPPKNQKAPRFPFLMRRFLEILVTSIICSVPIALMYQFGFTRAEIWATRVIGASLVAFVLMNAYLLRAFYFSMGNRKIYFSVNIVAYLLFAIFNVALLIILGDNQLPSAYSYMFMPMKFANVIINMITQIGNSRIQISCAILTHMLMMLIILVSPFEMYSFDKKKK